MKSSARSAVNDFAALELDRCAEQREDAAPIAERSRAANARYLILRPDGHALVSAGRRALLQLDHTLRERGVDAAVPSFLGRADQTDHFALSLDEPLATRIATEVGGEFLDLRSAGALF